MLPMHSLNSHLTWSKSGVWAFLKRAKMLICSRIGKLMIRPAKEQHKANYHNSTAKSSRICTLVCGVCPKSRRLKKTKVENKGYS